MISIRTHNQLKTIQTANRSEFKSHWIPYKQGLVPHLVLGTFLLNTQHYNVRIKGKVEHSSERSCRQLYLQENEKHPPLHFGVVEIEKEASGSPSTTIANLPNICFKLIRSHLDGELKNLLPTT